TTLAESALMIAEPVSSSAADGSAEFTAMLQPLRVTEAEPAALSAPLAFGSRARTQALPTLPETATARARTATSLDRNMAEKSRGCGCAISTSTAAAFAAKAPLA